MTGEKDLNILLKTMTPALNAGEYVFCQIPDMSVVNPNEVVMLFREQEGITGIMKKEVADSLHFKYLFVAAWITLTVHSSLQAVGLTAAFSKALADAGISCNVVAAYCHDHIFVDKEDGERAMHVLQHLSKNA